AGGKDVAFLAMFGCPYPAFFRPLAQIRYRAAHRAENWRMHARALAGRSWSARVAYLSEVLKRRRASRPDGSDAVLARRRSVERATLAAVRAYRPGFFAGRIPLFMPCSSWVHSGAGGSRWSSLALGAESYFGPDGCTADNMLLAPQVSAFADLYGRSC